MAAKNPQSQSVSAGRGSVTASSAGLRDDETRRKRIGNADKYAVGICRDVSTMLRIVISNDLVQQNRQLDIQSHYVNVIIRRGYDPQKVIEPKNGKEDIDEYERPFFVLIGYLQRIFLPDEVFFDPESDQVKQVRKYLREIALRVNRKGGQRSLFDKAMKPIRSNSILTQQIAQKLSLALMHQLLMYQVDLDMPELVALAKHLKAFNDRYGNPLKDRNNQEASALLSRLEQTWERIKKQKTHLEDSTEDVTAYNSFKNFLLLHCTGIFDEEMMKQFADYKTEMEEDKIVEEQLGHLKRYADILIKARAFPEGATLEQIKKAVMQRGEAITPQILEELYLRVALCMRINNAYMINSETIRYSVLYSKWAGKGQGKDYSQDKEFLKLQDYIRGMMANTNKCQGASMKAIRQASQDISNRVDRNMDVRGLFCDEWGSPKEVGGLSKYQQKALWVHGRLVHIKTTLQRNPIKTTLTEVNNLLRELHLQKTKDYASIKWSPFYDKTLDEFSTCFKTYEKNNRNLPTVSYLSALLTRLQVAVLDEVLVQLSGGLDYLCKNFWFSDDDVKNGIRKEIDNLRLVANDRKHQLGFFCASIAKGTYLDSFNYLLHKFFTPELAGLCSTDQMIGERTKRGKGWWE